MSIVKVTLALVASAAIVLSGHAQNVGNWSMSGRVVDAATGRPIAGARVAATADTRQRSAYLADSDSDGAYHFDRMVSGTYVVYVTVTHRTVPAPAPPALMDAGGRYRLDLDPRSLMPLVQSQTFTFATTFHPSAASYDSARRVSIDAGQSRPGIDIGVRRVPARRVTGTVVGPRFRSPDGPGEVLVLLSADDERFQLGGNDGGVVTASTITQDGPFVFMAVPPGTYTLEAYQARHGDISGSREVRMVRALTVGDADVSGVTVNVPVR